MRVSGDGGDPLGVSGRCRPEKRCGCELSPRWTSLPSARYDMKKAERVAPSAFRVFAVAPAQPAMRSRIRAQERAPLWKLFTSYFSFGLWIASSSLA